MNSQSRKVTMAVFREQLRSGDLPVIFQDGAGGVRTHQAIYLLSGTADTGATSYISGDGFYLCADVSEKLVFSENAEILRFVFSRTELTIDGVAGLRDSQYTADKVREMLVMQQTFTTSEPKAVLRLDRVDFPPGAVAYRHTHPGGGLRYLTSGALTLDATGNIHQYSAGDAWFEDANSPVMATADETQDSQFIRMMLLPMQCKAKSTFIHINKEDEKKPRLQSNIRFFDEVISL